MKTYFDSNVLVSLLNARSAYKPQADAALAEAGDGAFTSAHALAETYRTLTTLALPIPPRQARQLVDGLGAVMEIVEIPRAAYDAALAAAAKQGLAGAIIYDALHCHAARHAKAGRIVTRNAPHLRLFGDGMDVREIA